MKYRCVKDLVIDRYDDDGFRMDGKYIAVKTGEIWTKDDTAFRMVGMPDTIRLEKEDDSNWMEIMPETLRKYFEEISELPKAGDTP